MEDSMLIATSSLSVFPARPSRRRPWIAGALLLSMVLPVTAAQTEGSGVATGRSAELEVRLNSALRAKGKGYEPRTKHLRSDGSPLFTNRLILEDSPYLQQHAHNPVDWYPWGDDAFEKARAEGKPVFLSIGYSTCHWCHVMEEESFDNLEVAALMNKMFVSIKVDREQRPDLDDIYMTAIHLTRGRGGWPMSSFLTPEGKPFFGATYFPAAQFIELLNAVDRGWREERPNLVATADRLASAVREVTAARTEATELSPDAARRASVAMLGKEDKEFGGFGSAPKFANEPDLLFLLDRALRTGDPALVEMLERNLDAMARGGIFDQVGGGFHRYSTDAQWLVPHFEKMLYNQAHLARAYLVGYRLLGRPYFRRVAEQTLDYVLREMTAPEGGFYSATDADSEGEEGLFFLWTQAELNEALGAERAEPIAKLFGVSEAGNFEGSNILHLPVGLDDFAAERELDLGFFLQVVDNARQRLWVVREGREHPLRDDKIITAWNGMMITTLADAYSILGEPEYRDAALSAARFLWRENRREEGRLWRVHLRGSSSIAAMQEDYAYLAEALFQVYDISGEVIWLERAEELLLGMKAQFWDREDGGFFSTSEEIDPNLIAVPKSPRDLAIPSGNSVAMRSLALAYNRTGRAQYRQQADELVLAFSGLIEKGPSGFAYLLLGAAELEQAAVGSRLYAARGKVSLRTETSRVPGGLGVALHLRIAPGWHINSFAPLGGDLVATSVELEGGAEGWKIEDLAYPDPSVVQLGFQADPLSVYDGDLDFRLRLEAPPEARGAGGIAPLLLRLQACDDRVCLRPEELSVRLPLAPILGPSGNRF